MKLHLDIETYSSVDIRSAGAYKYIESDDFEILMIAYAFDDEPVQIIDLTEGDEDFDILGDALYDPNIEKHAHNATFERLAFRKYGIDTPIGSWRCSAIKATYCGLPLKLKDVSAALHFDDDTAKMSSGKALIRYFCMPCKPTKTNGGRTRNLPEHAPEKWEEFKEYCIRDVIAEREIDNRLSAYEIPEFEQIMYRLDQEINDRGVKIDLALANNACKIDDDYSNITQKRITELTGLDNPNSVSQLKEWMQKATGRVVESMAKENVSTLLENCENKTVQEVLQLRQLSAKTSIKKYTAMLACAGSDGRGRGFFQFYGANRTGRWAGRLVQLQNLARNYLPDLDTARQLAASGNYLDLEMVYGDVSDTLSQLIRTAFVAPEGKTLAVADFSAIEARVIAWLAEEKWRMNVFSTHGKIYEASAAQMFGVPIESVTKGSDLRQKGKVAELALGYQGGVGAMKTMGAEKMGLSESEMDDIVKKWRKASPNIVTLWKDLEGCAKAAIKTKKPVVSRHRGLVFDYDGYALTIQLPSGRKLFYVEPKIKMKTNRKANGDTWDSEAIMFKGMDQVKKRWGWTDTYGGKLAENIVQAIARDLLAYSIKTLDYKGYKVIMHIHDEVVCEANKDTAEISLQNMCDLMSLSPLWAQDLRLTADGYITDYYKKD